MRFVRLGDCTTKIGSGQTPSGGHRAYSTSGIPLIRSQNVLMGCFTTDGLAFISAQIDEQMRGTRVVRNDVLLNITGASIGRVCVVPDEICPANVNQHVCIIRCSDVLLPAYLALVLASPEFQSLIWQDQAGATRQALTKDMVESFQIPWRPIEEQRQIAARLKAKLAEVETARQAAQAQLREVSSLADAIVLDSVRNHSVTEHSLGDVLAEVKRGIGARWSDYPVLGATRDGLAPAKEAPGKHAIKYKPVLPGTVFYNPMRILIGSIAFVDDGDTPGITSPDYVVLQGKPDLVDSRWFYYWLRSPLGVACINSLARGAVRERMLFNRLAEGEIELPAYSVQQRASTALQELVPLKRIVAAQLAEIERLPQKLLAQAFTHRGETE
ncbi:MAG: restriction endonuclease subunit S [Propionivibrio sp.]|uniref:restriction endonuclease subunit S n=1 Tax=Propionivibrio sp. TaxID=2212460 RepID=UPI001B5A13BD|nr:restriction endonuclease subunit S [Propionivibrio sp.]MBP7202301.1 restriction endonuclease subunit S [Propionivibrio sp.]